MELYESESVELKEIYTLDLKKVEEVLGSGTTHAINMLKEMLEKDLIIKVGKGRLTKYIMKQ